MPTAPDKRTDSHWLARLGRLTAWLEDSLLVVMLTVMILVGAAQILLRNFLDAGLVWGDALLRALVLWVGLLGAVVASRTENHITIDILSRYLAPRRRIAARLVTDLFTVVVCAVVSWHAATLVRMDREAAVEAFSGVPAWTVELIIPVGFAIMALRYLESFLRGVWRLWKGEGGG